MEEIKVFLGVTACDLEKQANNWLVENNGRIEITRALQSSAAIKGVFDDSFHTYLTIFYKDLTAAKQS